MKRAGHDSGLVVYTILEPSRPGFLGWRAQLDVGRHSQGKRTLHLRQGRQTDPCVGPGATI